MMGTFTKSFDAIGGYIAGSVEFIAALRAQTSGFLTDNAMSPVVCQQILTAFKVMKGEDGTNIGAEKLARLKDNANYFRERLIAMGLDVYGEADSPVIPMMLYNPTKIAAFSRYCLDEGVRLLPFLRLRSIMRRAPTHPHPHSHPHLRSSPSSSSASPPRPSSPRARGSASRRGTRASSWMRR